MHENESNVKLVKDLFKHLVIEARTKTSDGIYKVAEKIEPTKDQKNFCHTFHRQMETRKAAREFAKAQPAPAKA